MKSISIILPCYNEEEALPLYFQNVDPIIKEIKDYNFNFILVNDGSKDKTLEVMNELYQKRDDIEIVNLARNFGQNPAIYAGLSVCDSDFTIVMDADLQDPVELIKTITEKFSEGYDVVSPHRANRKSDTWFKRTTAGLFYKFVNAIEGKKVIPENVNAFRGVSRRVVKLFNELPNKVSSASATLTPTATIPVAISAGAMTQTTGGWTSWLRRPAGRSLTWDKTVARFHPPLQTSLLTRSC